MSIAGIGSHGPGNLSQMLSSLLSRLDKTSSKSTSTDTSTSTQATTTTVSSDSNLTGASKPSLSGMILGTLIGLQGQNTQTSATSPSDAAQNLFSAMDGDSDGNVSKSELETYLQGVGGTSDQADSLYSLLGGGDKGISEDQMSSAMPQPPAGGPPPGMGGFGGPQGGSSSGSAGDSLVSLFDTNNDKSVSKSEYTSFVTAHGGTESDAESQFTSLLSDGSDQLTASNFNDAVNKLQNSYSNDPYAAILNLLGNLSNSSGSAVSVSA